MLADLSTNSTFCLTDSILVSFTFWKCTLKSICKNGEEEMGNTYVYVIQPVAVFTSSRPSFNIVKNGSSDRDRVTSENPPAEWIDLLSHNLLSTRHSSGSIHIVLFWFTVFHSVLQSMLFCTSCFQFPTWQTLYYNTNVMRILSGCHYFPYHCIP